jgi:hypothetical protein
VLIADLPERLQAKISGCGVSGCWLWSPVRKDGYALAYWEGRRPLAHRLVWELLIGPIEPGLQLDHVRDRGCINRNCVNPAHLEPVTPLTNTRRSLGNNSKTHCPKGHPYDDENTLNSKARWHRQCRRCTYKKNAQWETRNSGYKRPNKGTRKTDCVNGHPYEGNRFPSGGCRVCKQAIALAARQRSLTDSP